MGDYKPPFTITNEILSYVSSISEKIGQISAISNLCILRSPADFDAFQSGRCAEHNGRPESLVIMD